MNRTLWLCVGIVAGYFIALWRFASSLRNNPKQWHRKTAKLTNEQDDDELFFK